MDHANHHHHHHQGAFAADTALWRTVPTIEASAVGGRDARLCAPLGKLAIESFRSDAQFTRPIDPAAAYRHGAPMQGKPGVHTFADLLEGQQLGAPAGTLNFRGQVGREILEPPRVLGLEFEHGLFGDAREQGRPFRKGFAVIAR